MALTGIFMAAACWTGCARDPIDPIPGAPDVNMGNLYLPAIDLERCFSPDAVAPVRVDNAKVSAAISGTSLSVAVPLMNDLDDTLAASVEVALLSLNGEVVNEQSMVAEIPPRTDGQELTFEFDLPPELDSADDLSGYVLRYDVIYHSGVFQALRNSTGKVSLMEAVDISRLVLRGPSTFMAGSENHLRMIAQDEQSGAPLSGISATFTLLFSGNGEMAFEPVTLTSDASGAFDLAVDIPAGAEGALQIDAQAEIGGLSSRLSAEVQVVSLSDILMTTDKPIYQPGQTIHLRALAMERPSLTPLATEELLFEISDSKGNKVFKQRVDISDFGVAFARFRLASEVLLGEYRVQATVGGETVEKTITVDRYSLPRFGVTVDTARAFYRPGEVMQGTLSAQYFFGKPVAGADVTIELQKVDVAPTTVAVWNAVTDADGRLGFQFTLPDYFVGQPLNDGNATVSMKIEVTDAAGQSRTLEVERPVVDAAILAQLIPESGDVVPWVVNRFYLVTTSPDGALVPTVSRIVVGGATIDVSSDDSGLAEFEFLPRAEAPLEMTVTSEDGDGNRATRSFSFTPGANQSYLLLQTDRSVYQVGDTVTATIHCPPLDGVAGEFRDRAYLDVIKDGRTVQMTTVLLEDGAGSFDFEVTPELVGGFEMEAYYIRPDSIVVRDRKLVYADPANQLQIEATTDRDLYAPADEAQIHFRVRDQQGNPVQSALGIQIVDEAVFSMMEFRPGLEKVFYAIQQEILNPQYEIHGYALDDVTDSADGDEDARDMAADVVFSAAGGSSYGMTEDSLQDLQSTVRNDAQEAVRIQMSQMETLLAHLCTTGQINSPDAMAAFISRNGDCWVDPWGTHYRVNGGTSNWELRSVGPDKEELTADDIVDSVNYFCCNDEDECGSWYSDADSDSDSDSDSDADSDGDGDMDTDSGGGQGVTVRKNFPETLYVNPEVITDASGEATISVPLADSITTWRMSTLASNRTGLLGSMQRGITVFQDFFIDIDFPPTLTQGDEVSVPVALYNYLDTAQTVSLTVQQESWFELLESPTKDVTLDAGEVAGTSFRVRVLSVGWHAFTIVGLGDTLSDAVARTVEVRPDGKEIADSWSGRLQDSVQIPVQIPLQAVDEASKILVKVFPGMASQAVEGFDSLLRQPTGCFEQTSSSTYPNVLVLNYLQGTDLITPAIEATAREYISIGYQRLLTFEVSGGGFEWFGDTPAHNILTAYGLLEFSDMARVHPVDENIIVRTQNWLAAQQAADGSFAPSYGGIAEGAINAYEDDLARTTAYLTFALAQTGYMGPETDRGIAWLKSHLSAVTDNYGRAMLANALLARDVDDAIAHQVLLDLHAGRVEVDGAIHWEGSGESTTYGTGDVMSIETTALIGFAMLRDGGFASDIPGISDYLLSQKDAFGNWQTTQATILTLKFLLESMNTATVPGAATISIHMDGTLVETLDIDEESSDVLRLVDLGHLTHEGATDLQLSILGDSSYMYQVISRYYVPWDEEGGEPATGPLDITVSYDTTNLTMADTVSATATIENTVPDSVQKMVLVSLGIPPGFTPVTDDLQTLVDGGVLQKFEKTPQQLILYVEGVFFGEPLTVTWQLLPRFPITVSSGASEVHPYYSPGDSTQTVPALFHVSE